ncbi:MAG: hypothetical protein ACT4OF_10840 [Caulobacteraceae bacterium]
MKNVLISLAFAGALLVPGLASAGDESSDRTAAINLCRAEVTAQAGDGAEVRFDQVRVRPRAVRVDFDLWRNGQLQNIRCEVTPGGAELVIASITPALQTASVTN